MADEALNHSPPVPREPLQGWLEVLDRTGKVALRYPLKEEALNIGRGYDNDIILDDPYVCPHHLSIVCRAGRLEVQDLQSVNGVFFGRKEEKSTMALVDNDGRFRVGRTTLRFRRHDCALPATWVDRPLHAPLRLVERPWVLVLLFLAVVCYQGLDFFYTSSSRIEYVGLVTEQVALVAVIIGWSALWAFPSRLLMGRWNFLVHCGIASFGILAQAGCEIVLQHACYALDLDLALRGLVQLCGWLVLLAVLYAHMTYLVAAPASRLLRWAGGVTFCLAALVTLVEYLEMQEFRASPQFTMTLKAPPLRVTSGQPPESVMVQLDALRDDVTALGDSTEGE